VRGDSAPQVVVLGSPAMGSGGRDSTVAARIRRIPCQRHPSALQSSLYLNPDRARAKGKRICAKVYTSRKRSRKEVEAPSKRQDVGPKEDHTEDDVGDCGKVIQERQSTVHIACIEVGSVIKTCVVSVGRLHDIDLLPVM